MLRCSWRHCKPKRVKLASHAHNEAQELWSRVLRCSSWRHCRPKRVKWALHAHNEAQELWSRVFRCSWRHCRPKRVKWALRAHNEVQAGAVVARSKMPIAPLRHCWPKRAKWALHAHNAMKPVKRAPRRSSKTKSLVPKKNASRIHCARAMKSRSCGAR